jgi:hypothetical protein
MLVDDMSPKACKIEMQIKKRWFLTPVLYLAAVYCFFFGKKEKVADLITKYCFSYKVK